MNLDRDTLNELVTLLMPLMRNEQQRRALLTQALTGASILESINYEDPTRAFVVQAIEQLADYGEVEPGKPALWALMETASSLGIRGVLGRVTVSPDIWRRTLVRPANSWRTKLPAIWLGKTGKNALTH